MLVFQWVPIPHHIHCFNERIRLQGLPCDEDLICEAFSEIDAIRGEVSLSYFEFATLAALWIFRRKRVSVALLEVGLGGRLDAVNILDPDVSVITAVGLDHQDWLGDSREEIGLEKAGILRQEDFVCGDPDPPLSVIRKARELSCISSIRAGNSDFELTSSLKRRNGGVLSLMAANVCRISCSHRCFAGKRVNCPTGACKRRHCVDLEQAATILAAVRPPGRQELTRTG